MEIIDLQASSINLDYLPFEIQDEIPGLNELIEFDPNNVDPMQMNYGGNDLYNQQSQEALFLPVSPAFVDLVNTYQYGLPPALPTVDNTVHYHTMLPFGQHNAFQPMQQQYVAEPEPLSYAELQELQPTPDALNCVPILAQNYHYTQQFPQRAFAQQFHQNAAQNIPVRPHRSVNHSRQSSTHTMQPESPTLANAVEQVDSEPEPKRKRTKRQGKQRVAEEAEEGMPPAEREVRKRSAQSAWEGHEGIPHSSPSPPHSSDHEAPTLVERSGPMSRAIILPGKKKPGRKPVESKQGDDRRREQNRNAQRKFRSKKNGEVQNAEEKTRQAREDLERSQRHAEYMTDRARAFAQQNEQLRIQLMAAQTSPRNDSITEMQMPTPTDTSMTGMPATRRQPQTHGPYAKFVAPPTPPEPNVYETDFTNFGRAVYATTSSSSDLSPTGLVDDPCGFCTDAQNCACKQDSGPEPEPQGPGNCAACIADPQRAQACRQLAQSSTLYPNFRPLHSEHNGNISTTKSPQPLVRSDSHSSRLSCGQLIDRATNSGQPLAAIPKIFGERIHAHPTASGRYEFDEREAAQALQDLATRRTDFLKSGRS